MKHSFLSRFGTAAIAFVFAFGTVMQALPAEAIVVFQGNASFDAVFTYDGASYNDRTAAAANATTNDVLLGSVVSGDSLYLGMKSPFSQILFKVGTWGAGASAGIGYEYSNPVTPANTDGFSALTVTSNPSTDFTVASGNGVTIIDFVPPSDWIEQTVNGVTAYWVKLTTLHAYTTAPKASEIIASAYNLKVQINDDTGSAWTANLVPSLDANCGGIYQGEWNAGAGIHYYALKTDGGSCLLAFDAAGHATFKTTVSGLTNALKDLTATPYILNHLTKVSVGDEVGNVISNAGVTLGGQAPVASSNGYYYFDQSGVTNAQLVIARTGYVTENGASGNTAFASVSGGTTAGQTFIRLLSPNPSCTGSIAAGSVTGCAALRRDETFTVTAGGPVVSGATVTFYTNPGLTQIADDLSNTASATDAQATTDVSGNVKFALASGTYYTKTSAAGYADKTGTVTVTSGNANAHTVDMATQPPVDTTVSASMSVVMVSPSSITANGVQTGTVTVTAKNAAGSTLGGKSVMLSSSLGGVIITPASGVTDANGIATFTIKSSTVGSAQLTAVADGITVTTKPIVQFTAVGNCPYALGALVKLPDDGNANTQIDSAVYYYGKDCRRHAFPNDKVYFTWYADFSNVNVVNAQTLAAMSLGSNVTYRPGVKMVKFTTVNNVYAVGHGGVLRWVKSEAVATALYGSTWNKKIDDINDAFYVNYLFGADINAAIDYNVVTEMQNALTIDDNL